MKVKELSPEQRAELQKRYSEAGLKGGVSVMTVEKVEEKISEALRDVGEPLKTIEEQKNDLVLNFDVDIFKPVKKINEEGNEYQAQEAQKLCFKNNDLNVELAGKIPAGQSFQHPVNSFIIKIDTEQVVLSAELANKLFNLKG